MENIGIVSLLVTLFKDVKHYTKWFSHESPTIALSLRKVHYSISKNIDGTHCANLRVKSTKPIALQE